MNLELDDSTCDSASTDTQDECNQLLKMEREEEEWIEQQHNKEMARIKEMESLEQDVREKTLKKLLHILEKSKIYAKFLAARIENSYKDILYNGKLNKRNSKRTHETEDTTAEPENNHKKLKLDIPNSSQKEEESSVQIDKNQTNGMEQPLSLTYKTDIICDVKQPALLQGVTLRDYQLQGFTWLKLLFETSMNGILADEMGLGKTLQVIALLCHLYEKRVTGPFLIIAPLSTLPNWLLEFHNFAPEVPVVKYHGPTSSRGPLKEAVNRKTKILGNSCLPVVLTSYELPIRDRFLSSIKWKYMIIDEGHRLKNYKSILFRTLKTYESYNRLLLTGTPLQNNLTELWSLLNFLLPEIFNNLDAFQTLFHVEDIEASAVTGNDLLLKQHDRIITVLHEILTPFLLRREKKDVNLQLPKKKEVIVYCPLTNLQFQLYKATIEQHNAINEDSGDVLVIPDNPDGTKQKRYSKLRENKTPVKSVEQLEKFDDIELNFWLKNNKKYINVRTVLKKIVNHPYLIERPGPELDTSLYDEKMVSRSGKMILLDGLLKRLKCEGHKVLLFSTMTKLLDIIEEFVIMRGYSYERLDGNCDIEDRKLSINNYNTNENVFIFLLSTRAGGLGINLTAADTVIIFDSDWNPQADLQAQDRCHRIGQTRPVIVYRFVTTGTIDENIVNRANAKRKLERIIIQGGKFKNLPGVQNKCCVDLPKLLGEKLYNLEIHPNGTVLTDKQWEELLDRSAIEQNTTIIQK